MTKNRILALFGLFFVTFKMIENWGLQGAGEFSTQCHVSTMPAPRLHTVDILRKSQTHVNCLVAPYCAIPRDYLSDTPPIARYGVFGVSTWPIGCDTPSPFSECFPLGEHAKSRCDTPP